MSELSVPKISVVMSFFNAEKFIGESIESILNQTFKDFELIIIDDNSFDNSKKNVEHYLSDKRIAYTINNKRMGKVENLNLGIKMARANLIAILDGDDISMDTRLEKQYNFLVANPDITIVGTFVKIIDEEGRIKDKRTKPTNPDEIKKDLIVYNPLVQPSVMFRKDVVINLGGYRHQYRYGQDLDLWYRIIYSGYKASNIPEYLLLYRYHSGSTTHHSIEIAKIDFGLRRRIIKDFNLKVTMRQWILIYAQFLIGISVSGRTRQKIEAFYKVLFLHGK